MFAEQVQEEIVFKAAIKLRKAGERAAYLEKACQGDADLLSRVKALIEAHEGAGDYLDGPIIEASMAPKALSLTESSGTSIGRYKLLEKIGEGGFGVVWAAEQKDPVNRRVALKIIKLGMDTKQVVARFEAERQALALMDHPNIAKVLDGGSTDSGRPYFVMELVRGIPIIEYCDQEKCSIQDRLNLFIKVCHAIQHAHQKGIIHRDIKPSNILITLHDGVPVARVIDFGIAKATQQELTEKTIYTQHHQFIGTPVYMSPEQAETSGLDIDTRSDIYSLGVLLYELLTGRTPFDEKELLKSGIEAMCRIIREQEPPRPSTRFATLQLEDQSTTATRHATDSPKLISLLRGDLDWIVMTCLEKDRARRYDTANGLAMDITRHLNDEAVTARPPTVAYQLQKAWRRNKAVYMAAGIVVASLIIGIAMSLWQAAKATRAERQATRSEQQANASATLAQANSQLAERRALEARESEMNALQRAYNSDMSVAFRALEENLIGRVQDIVSRHVPEPDEPDFRGWEWRYAWAQSRSDAVSTWNTPAEMGRICALRISPDQRYLVSSDRRYKSVDESRNRRLWDFQTREELKHVLLPGGSERGLAFSNAGDLLALHHQEGVHDANEVHIYETSTWHLKTVIPSETWIHSLSFSPDDRTLAAVGEPGTVLWDWSQKRIVGEWPISKSQRVWDRDENHDVSFFPDGRRLAIAAHRELSIINLVTGDIEHQQPAPSEGACIAISPDSRYVVLGSGDGHGEISVLNTGSWELETQLAGHGDWVSSLTFTADGKRLISSSADNTLRVWDMNRRVTTHVLKGHQSHVYSFALASDGKRAVSAGWDEQILEWDLAVPQPWPREHQLAEKILQVVYSADSRRFYTLGKSGAVCIWDAKAFVKLHTLSPELDETSTLLLSPDGDQLIAGTGSGALCVWDTETLKGIAQRSAQSGLILPVGFLSDGTALVALEPGNKISLWDAKTWKLRSSTPSGLDIVLYSNACSEIPPKSDILLCPSGKDLVWWDLEQSKEFARARVHPRWAGAIAVSPTGSLLASACGDSFIFLLDWQTRQSVSRLRGSRGTSSVAFSPDGRRLISGGSIQEAITLWDVSTQQEISQFGTSSTLVRRVQFSPDHNTISAVDNSGIAYFWRAPSLESIDAIEAEQQEREGAL